MEELKLTREELLRQKMMTDSTFSTAFLLFVQYGGKSIITIDEVCPDYFSHLTPAKFLRKASEGEIKLPIVRMESSQKCHKGVHLQDLAIYVDARREAALKELRQNRSGWVHFSNKPPP